MPDLAGALAAGRARALTILTDTATLTTDADRNDDATLDPDTLVLSEVDDTVEIWSGACLLSAQATDAQTVAPATTVDAVRYRARLPYDAPLAPAGAILTISASLDPGMVGARMRVVAADLETFGVFRTLTVEPVL